MAKSERNDELRARLVDDPELLQKNIREANEALNNIRAVVAAEEAKSRDLKTRLDWLGTVETVRMGHLVIEWGTDAALGRGARYRSQQDSSARTRTMARSRNSARQDRDGAQQASD